jgi:hypothetical protein
VYLVALLCAFYHIELLIKKNIYIELLIKKIFVIYLTESSNGGLDLRMPETQVYSNQQLLILYSLCKNNYYRIELISGRCGKNFVSNIRYNKQIIRWEE